MACVPTDIEILSVAAFLEVTFCIKSLKDSKEKVTTQKVLIFEVSAQKPLTGDTDLEAMDAKGCHVSPSPIPPKTAASRFAAVPPNTPFQVVPTGGSLRVSV